MDDTTSFDSPDPNGDLNKQDGDSSIRLSSLPNRLPMLEHIMTESIKPKCVEPYRKRAQFTFFCGLKPYELSGYEGQLEVAGRCLEWFVFDYVIPNINMTPAKYWFEQAKNSLSEDQQGIARDCLRFRLGIFKIVAVNGHVITVVDILRKQLQLSIHEIELSKSLQIGQLLLARIFPQDNHFVLSGMTSVMSVKFAQQMCRCIDSGQLMPVEIVENLDGLELENLFGRSLEQVDRMEDIDKLHERLKYYLEHICPDRLGFYDLLGLVEKCRDPFSIASTLCDRLQVMCRHEMDLILAYSMATWYQTHKQ